jgi:hypothetical protein
MMNSDVKRLIEIGDKLFSKRISLVSLWQEIADNFYPERADFTVSRSLGTDFAEHLMTSYPLMARRDLGNAFSGMLRPTSKDWFAMRTGRDVRDVEGRAWLEWASKVQKRAMYDRKTQFIRATKEGDHDFAAVGQCVISVEMNRNLDGLLYRCWHLRDVAWCENEDGEIDHVQRKWKPAAHELNRIFKGNISSTVKEKLEKEPYCEIECRHIVVPSEMYAGEKKWRTKFVSLFVDVENKFVMEEVGIRTFSYVIPRWQTVSGSQYAYSPATVCALPDARLIQAMTRVLLEAGEKATNPPMVAVQEAIRSDVSIYAGGITWVDAAYDERLGEVLRPLTQDKTGLPLGLEMQQDIREQIAAAFYLNKLNLPIMAGDMTATEVSQRVQEYIRQALPLFEPMEDQYNGALCERTFDLLFNNGAFGPPDNIPESLRGQEVTFRFESPLQEAVERQRGQVFMEASAILAQAATLAPEAPVIVDAVAALRDVLEGIGVPASWTRSEDAVQTILEQQAAKQEAAQLLGAMEQASKVAKTTAEANATMAPLQ